MLTAVALTPYYPVFVDASVRRTEVAQKARESSLTSQIHP